TFVGPEVSADAEAAGGYARAQTAEEEARTREALAAAIPQQDLLISTAKDPGKRGPLLIDAQALATLSPGSEEGADAGAYGGTVVVGEGVVRRGAGGVGATVPLDASQMYARNLMTLVQHLSTKEGALKLDPEDEITKALLITLNGQVPGGSGR